MHVPEPLLDDIADARCLPFLGAGFSANAQLPHGESMPTWPGLTASLARVANVATDLPGPDVAERYERHFGRVHLIEAIRRTLHGDSARPGQAHLAFAELPFDTVYTTNFDLLVEDAIQEIRRPFRSLVGELQLPFHAGFLATNIIKMHGDLRHEEHVIITRADYETYLASYPVIATHLSAMLITRTALFVGYSRTDPDFLQIVDVVRSRLGRFQRMSYMIQFDVSEPDVEAALDDQMHVISLKVSPGDTRDSALAAFFREIQRRLDSRAGASLRRSRPDAFEPVEPDTIERSYRAPDAMHLLESSSLLCFVMAPYAPDTDAVYRQAIVPAIEGSGLTPLRADEMMRPGGIVEQVRSAIQQARVCIADLTGHNPNVMYEVGMAQMGGKPLILLARSAERIPFDVASLRVLIYDPSDPESLRAKLGEYLHAVLEEGKVAEAERLISMGSYRAAVAVLGVLLEQLLRNRTGSDPSTRLSLGRLVHEAARLRAIPPQTHDRLQDAVAVRNRAVHNLDEPSREDADFMFDAVRMVLGQHPRR